MTGREVNEALKRAGLSAEPDKPSGGMILITPKGALPADLRQLVVENKPALLAYLRKPEDEGRVAALSERIGAILENAAANAEAAASQSHDDWLAEVRAAVGDAKDDGPAFANADASFPHGNELAAANLIERLASAGCVLSIDEIDRGKIRPSRPLTPAERADVLALKPHILDELERRARAEELASMPSPFRGPGVVACAVAEGRSDVVADGLDRPPGGPLGFVGWIKYEREPWMKLCSAPEWGGCWAALLPLLKESGEKTIQATVIAAGRTPGRCG